MASKYELSISTDYVPDWTYVEAIREIFQNAIDNELVSPENEMEFSYDEENERLNVSNKTSVLSPESLLLGSSTKRNDKDTIGKHGEGYKIAFMVLLREGKGITVYNYGAKETWETRLVKARRYNNRMVPTITINKQALWSKVPNNNLTITIESVTKEEYENIKKSNLNIQDNVEVLTETSDGSILKSAEEKGNIYVKGLFVCNSKDIEYGYNFNPRLIELDRDRKLIDSFDVRWNASRIWGKAAKKSGIAEKVAELIMKNVRDVEYIKQQYSEKARKEVGNKAAELFLEEHGSNAYPVSDTNKLNKINHTNTGLKPIIVTREVEETILDSNTITVLEVFREKTVKERLELLIEKIENKLDDEELEEIEYILRCM